MTEHSDVVDRADSLMRRRRSFVASVSGKTEPISAPPPISEDEDLPVLTEVVSAEAVIPETQAEPYIEEALLSIIAADLVHTLERQLAIELPSLIEATLLNAQEELRSGINSTLDMALRDFLARRHQLSLSLNEPSRDDD
jgi:hypothetical protein